MSDWLVLKCRRFSDKILSEKTISDKKANFKKMFEISLKIQNFVLKLENLNF